MNESQLTSLLGGSVENVNYYLGLREALAAVQERNENTLVTCDPRDLVMRERLESLQWKPSVDVRQFDDFKGCSNEELYGHSNKQTAVDDEIHDDCNDDDDENVDCGGEESKETSSIGKKIESDRSFVCGVHGCCEAFSSLASYESHYHMCHNHVCSHCKRVLASGFLLDVHLQENHDSYFQILSSRIDMYRCLVENCEAKFRTPELRKDHLVVHHKFPASFSFHQPLKSSSSSTSDDKRPKQSPCCPVQPAKDKKSSKKSTAKAKGHFTTGVMEVDHADNWSQAALSKDSGETRDCVGSKNGVSNGNDMECDTVRDESDNSVNSASQGNRGRGKGGKGHFVPRVVCFGRGARRAFRSRGRGGHWHQWGRGQRDTSTDIEQMDFKDLSDALQS